MKKFLLGFAATMFASTCWAAQPSIESIDALMAASKADKLTESMQANMEPMMRRMMSEMTRGKKMGEEEQRVLEQMPARFAKVMRDEMKWETMRPLYIEIYRDAFTQEEIDSLVAFYRSPAGVALIDKMPMVMQKSMEVMQRRMGPMMERMAGEMKKAVDDVRVAPQPR